MCLTIFEGNEVLEVVVSNSNNNFRHWKSLERLFLAYKSNPTRRTYKMQVLRVWFKLQGGGIQFNHLWCERCFIEDGLKILLREPRATLDWWKAVNVLHN